MATKLTEQEQAAEVVRQATNGLQHVEQDGVYSARAEWETQGSSTTRKMVHVEVNDVRVRGGGTETHYYTSVTLERTFKSSDEAEAWIGKLIRG